MSKRKKVNPRSKFIGIRVSELEEEFVNNSAMVAGYADKKERSKWIRLMLGLNQEVE